MMEAPKYCPFINSFCITDACACYIKIGKPMILSKKLGLTDPDRFYAYKGCGLVTAISWKIIDRREHKEELKTEIESLEK